MKKIAELTLLAIALVGVLIERSSAQTSSGEVQLAEKVYSDPKGFFQIRPPAGWSIHEYPDDPRGKVDFRIPPGGSPGQLKAELKVQGRLSNFSDITALRANAEAEAERVRQRLGVSVSVEEARLFEGPALVLKIQQAQLQQENYQVIIGKNLYVFFIGATPRDYDQFRPVAFASIQTMVPVFRDLSKDEALRHSVAAKLRVAQLYFQMGQKVWALQTVDEALALAPHSKEALEMKAKLVVK
jgi:hypothetical protein